MQFFSSFNVLPCRKAVFTSKEFNAHWLDDMQQDNRSHSLEQVGLSTSFNYFLFVDNFFFHYNFVLIHHAILI